MIHLIWDLDGTLVDSFSDIRQCLGLAVEKSGLDPAKQIKPFVIGPPIDKILLESFPSDIMTDALLNMIIATYREIYDNSSFAQTKPFFGIEDIIFDTMNFTHYVVTNKPDKPANRILDKLNLSKYITSVKTPYSNLSALSKKTPSKTELFSELIAESGVEASSFIGIGDVKTDCLAAKDNNITAVGVLWGSGTEEELFDSCDYLFGDTKQLYDFLYK